MLVYYVNPQIVGFKVRWVAGHICFTDLLYTLTNQQQEVVSKALSWKGLLFVTKRQETSTWFAK